MCVRSQDGGWGEFCEVRGGGRGREEGGVLWIDGGDA